MSIHILKAVILTAMTTLLLSAGSTSAQEIDAEELQRKVREKLEELFDEETQEDLAGHLQEALERLQEGFEGAGDELGGAFDDLQRDLEDAGNDFGQRLSEKVEELLEDEDFNELRHAMENGDFRSLLRNAAAPPVYWVGLQLKIDNETVSVAGVMDGSPAAKAGFESGDIIQRVNRKEISSAQNLIEIIRESKGEPLAFRIERDSKRRDIKVAPAQREVAGGLDIDAIDELLGELADSEQGLDVESLHRLMEKFGVEMLELEIPRAAIPKRLPPNVSLTIKRTGLKPPEITVSRDDEVWKISEKEIASLPEDLQPFVKQALGIAADNEKVEADEAEAEHGGDEEQNDKLEDLNQRVRELQKQLKKLQDSRDES